MYDIDNEWEFTFKIFYEIEKELNWTIILRKSLFNDKPCPIMSIVWLIWWTLFMNEWMTKINEWNIT